MEKELLFFYLPGCPYCRQAEELITELTAEHPEYAGVNIHRVSETGEADFVSKYDYWYVPCFWLDGRKLYEADPKESRETVKVKLDGVFQQALKA
jgi:Glutaredoxin and related proteins